MGGFDKDFALKDLARVGSEGKAALPALMSVLANDPSEGYRRLAAEAIGTLGADAASAIEVLAKALGDGDADVRFASAWALASIGDTAQLAAIRALEMLYTKSAWGILKRHWQRSGMPSPYEEAQLRTLIGAPR